MTKFPTERPLTGNPSELSRKILEKILLEMELPNCFGLYGNWGSGKSSVLKGIQEIIDSEYAKIIYIHFDAWKYEYSKDNDLLFALLSEIKKKFNLSKKNWKKLSVITGTVFSSLIKSISIDIGGIGIKGDSFSLQEISKEGEFLESKLLSDHERWIDTIENFKKDFEKIIKEGLIKNKTEKLFIFIDDLDRCLPESTVKLIEAIKNFLSVENTLFLFAVDQRVVSEMIEKKYGLHCGYGDEYLLKVIPYYFEMSPVDLGQEIEKILNRHDITVTENELGYIKNFFINFVPEARIMKHYLHQIGITVNLIPRINTALSDQETNVHYIIIAFYLLKKFPALFGKSKQKRQEIIDGIGYSIRHKGKENMHNIESMSENEKIELHVIFQSVKEQANLHLDLTKLSLTMDFLKKII